MHTSNKYKPYKASRTKWECWKLTDGEYENKVNERKAWYRNWYGVELDDNDPYLKIPRYETNCYYFGAYPKQNGAWGSNNASGYLKHAKKNSTHVYRGKEKRALHNYLKNGDYEEDIGNILHGEGYWD